MNIPNKGKGIEEVSSVITLKRGEDTVRDSDKPQAVVIRAANGYMIRIFS